jgi:transcription elongation factor
MIKTCEKVAIDLKVWTKDLMKYFETGELVRIISGNHAGVAG